MAANARVRRDDERERRGGAISRLGRYRNSGGFSGDEHRNPAGWAGGRVQSRLIFAKQSHQVIENIRERPKKGQNKPNLVRVGSTDRSPEQAAIWGEELAHEADFEGPRAPRKFRNKATVLLTSKDIPGSILETNLASAARVDHKSHFLQVENMCTRLSFLIVVLAMTSWPMQVRAQQPSPMTQDEVAALIKQNKKNPGLILKTLDERQVDFDLNRDIEKKMRKAGATDDVLQAIWRDGPSNRNAKSASLVSATGGQLQATYQEAMGYQTLQAELDPDKKLRMVEEFEKQFPNSQLLSYVYTQAASACQQKNDLNGILSYGEKSLKLDPDNTYSLILVAITLPQPQMQRVEPAEAAKRLAKADEDAKRALALMDKLAKRPNETDEQFQKRKAALQSEAHAALGMVHLQRDEPDKAIEEFKTAVSQEAAPDPQIYYRLGEVYANEDKKAEALEAFTKASELGRGTPIQDLADQEIEKLKKQ